MLPQTSEKVRGGGQSLKIVRVLPPSPWGPMGAIPGASRPGPLLRRNNLPAPDPDPELSEAPYSILLSVPKFIANLYFICLSIDLRYT